MKKYLILLVLLGCVLAHEHLFEEKLKNIVLASVISDIECDKCRPGEFWNDFMQRCERIPGWVPKKDSSEYKQDKGYNLLPYGAQDVNKSGDDVAKYNLQPAPATDDFVETTSDDEYNDSNTNKKTKPTPVQEEEPYDPNW